MNGFHFWNKEKPITRKGFLYMELKWKQRFAMQVINKGSQLYEKNCLY